MSFRPFAALAIFCMTVAPAFAQSGTTQSPARPETPAPASADSFLSAADPAGIQQAIQDAGYKAQLDTAGDGSPLITSRVSRSNYAIFFYDCSDEGDDCLAIEFSSGYTLDPEHRPTLEQINGFNAGYRYVRAYLDEDGEPHVELDLRMSDGGLRKEIFLAYLTLWEQIVSEFEQAVKF